MSAAVGSSGEYLLFVLVEANLYGKKVTRSESHTNASHDEEKRKTLDDRIREMIPEHIERGEFHVLASIADGFGLAHLSEITKNEAGRAILPAAMKAIGMHAEKIQALPVGNGSRSWHIEKLKEIACWERLPREAREKASQKLAELKVWSDAQSKLALAPRRREIHRFHLKRIGISANKASAIIGNVGKAAIF